MRRAPSVFLLFAVVLASAQPASAMSRTRPPLLERWPVCDSTRSTFCVEALSVDGVNRLGSPDWQVDAYLLDDHSSNWYVEQRVGSAFVPPLSTTDQFSFRVNTGDVAPLFTQATAANVFLTTGGSATDGFTVSVDAQAVTLDWKNSTVGGDCHAGHCGDDTTAADSENNLLGGNSQDMATWDPDLRALFRGMWTATDAEYQTLPLFQSSPAQWFLSLGNPHLKLDGVTPVVGTYSAYVPPQLLSEVGATAAQAAATGLNVTRTDGGVTTTVGAAIMATGDGGVYIRVPEVHYSTARFRFHGTGGHKTVIGPDPARRVHPTPLDGAAIVRFAPPNFDGGSKITGYIVRCVGSGPIRTASSSAAVAVQVPLRNGDQARCTVRARNANQVGASSYPVFVTALAGLPPQRPGATPSIIAKVAPSGGVVASWARPSANGGAAIDGYRVVVCRAAHACPGSPVLSKHTDGRSVQIAPGRLASGTYTLIVQAHNSAGFGDVARKTLHIS
jgi:hypothetical protein